MLKIASRLAPTGGKAACFLQELACKRFVPGTGHHLTPKIASRLAPTGGKAACFL